jgi:Helix-turn-helix domain
MSGLAMSWAANALLTGPLLPSARLVLIVMAEPADADGTCSFLSHRTIAARTGLSERQVTRLVRQLESEGLITKATEQGPANYIRADRRPVVYDLTIGQISTVSPRGDTHDMSSSAPRGDTQGRHGVTPMSDEPRTKPSTESLSREQRIVADVLELSADDERLTSVGRMLRDQGTQRPVPWIRTCAKNGDLIRLLDEAHNAATLEKHRAALARAERAKEAGDSPMPANFKAMIGAL